MPRKVSTGDGKRKADAAAAATQAPAKKGAGDGNATAAHSADTTGSVHKAHPMKTGLI